MILQLSSQISEQVVHESDLLLDLLWYQIDDMLWHHTGDLLWNRARLDRLYDQAEIQIDQELEALYA